MSGIHQFETTFLLLLIFLIGFGTLAKKIKVPYPIILVIGGLLVSFVPGIPHFDLNPDLVFLVLLPPLLFSAAYNTSWRDFRRSLPAIISLGFVLVAITALGVALAAHWIIPDFDWRLGLVLGAILSPTDAIAATSIAKRLSLPTRITDLLEGESLVNDGSGLLALEFAVAMVVTGENPTFVQGLWRLSVLILGGIIVGLVVGKLIYLFESWIDDAPVEITASFVTPYLAYLGAEALHTSGVLSAVACGLYLGRHSSVYLSSSVRIQASSAWNIFTFILNGLAFLLIGLQLPYILGNIHSISFGQLMFDSGVVVLVVVLLRLAWVYPGAFLSKWVTRRFSPRTPVPLSNRGLFIVGWTGMRGVVSLAAAFSLPVTISTGAPFPERSIILFITFIVIFFTLVPQGLTLPSVIRYLGLGTKEHADSEEQFARRQILHRALDELGSLQEANQDETAEPVYEEIAQQYRARLSNVDEDQQDQKKIRESRLQYRRYRELTQRLREVERATAVALRDQNKINDEVLRTLERELDLLDTRYAAR